MSKISEITHIYTKRYGGKLLRQLEKLIANASTVPNQPFYDPHMFDWVEKLENNWQVMREEVDEILRISDVLPSFQDISEDQKVLTEGNDWKTFFLYGFGYKMDFNCNLAPKTAALLEDIPELKTAFFSILAPGKHIPEHRGLYKGLLRYHLGLKIPEPREKVRIRVADQTRHWEEGKSLLFDDTYLHEAWNETDQYRVILFVDVLRPLKYPVNKINDLILNLVKKTSYVQNARKNQERWEAKMKNKVLEKVNA